MSLNYANDTTSITEDDVYLNTYNTRLNNLFVYISELAWEDYQDNVVSDNFSFWDYTIDAFNGEHMDYFLDENNSWYEVFAEYNPWELIHSSNESVLKLILSWELRVAFINNYSKILLLNKSIQKKYSDKVSEILYLN